jgi:hypothetical protein
MNWIQIMRLIVVLWPLIELILSGEPDQAKRDAKTNAIPGLIVAMLTLDPPPKDAADVVGPIAKALRC